MKDLIFSLFLITTLVGCDYTNNTRVCNQTVNEIVLKITFDSNVIKTWSGGMLVNIVTNTFENWDVNLTPKYIDTINYIASYLIQPDSCGQIEGGNNRKPHFLFYKKLEIITHTDTIKIQTKEEMRRAFDANRENPEYYFDLLVLNDGKCSSR